MKRGFEREVGVEQPFHQVCLEVVSWQTSAKVEREHGGPGALAVTWFGNIDSDDIRDLATPFGIRACLCEVINERMCHFLGDTPLLMTCQIAHTAAFMFC